MFDVQAANQAHRTRKEGFCFGRTASDLGDVRVHLRRHVSTIHLRLAIQDAQSQGARGGSIDEFDYVGQGELFFETGLPTLTGP